MGDRVGIKEAARRLGFDKSLISRQVGKFGIARDSDGKFDIDELLAARARSGNPLMRRESAGADSPAADLLDGVAANDAVEQDASRAKDAAAQPVNAATRHKELQSEKLELELRQAKGELVEIVEVQEAFMTAMRKLRDTFLGLSSRVAGELTSMNDAGEIRKRLDTEIRGALDTVAKELDVYNPDAVARREEAA